MTDDENTLKLAAAQARYGADDVVRRLRIELESGVPSIAQTAYTLRIRIKDDYKIVEKVKKKRIMRPDYDVNRITDVVGLRVVTLHRVEALDIIPRLLKLMLHDGKNPDALFIPKTLSEIIIYSTNPTGDAQALPQRLISLYEIHGLRNIAVIDQTPSNYSSIHMLASCRGQYGGRYHSVPVEIQIRTAFEDAWSEIDHRMKYKPADHSLTVREGEILQSAMAHLNVMKTFVDGAAQYADQIKVQEQQLTSRGRMSLSTLRPIEDTAQLVGRMVSIPPQMRSRITYGFDQQNEAMSPERRDGKYSGHRIVALREAAETFNEVLNVIQDEMSPGKELDELKNYYLPMEEALCRFQLGYETKGNDEFANAIKLYEKVQEQYPDRAIVKYRYARALKAIGDAATAYAKMTEACDLLKENNDQTLADDHWLRAAAPRLLGVMMWDKAELQRSMSGAVNDSYMAIYREAFAITIEAYAIRVEPDQFTSRFNQISPKANTANNLIQYSLDYFEYGGELDDLQNVGYSEELFNECLSQVLVEPIGEIDAPEILDTLRRVCQKRGVHRDKLGQICRQVIKTVGDRGGVGSFDADMLAEARAALVGLEEWEAERRNE